MFYLIMIDDDYTTKIPRKRGCILEKKAESYELITKKFSQGIVESDSNFKVGDIVPELVDKYFSDATQRKLLELAIEVITYRNKGRTKMPDALMFEIADMQYSLEKLMTAYEAKAIAVLEQRENEKIEESLKSARRSNILFELSQLNGMQYSEHPAMAGIQANMPAYQVFLPVSYIAEHFTLPALDKAATVRCKAISERVMANSNNFVCPALTVSVSGKVSFTGDKIGTLAIAADAQFFVHFGSLEIITAIIDAAKNKTALNSELVPVCLLLDKSLVTKRINTLLAPIESSQPSEKKPNGEFVGWIKLLKSLLPYPALNDPDSVLYQQKFSHFITIATGITIDDPDNRLLNKSVKSNVTSCLLDTFNALEKSVPELSDYLSGKIKPAQASKFIFSYPAFWNALACVIRCLISDGNDYDPAQVNRLQALKVLNVHVDGEPMGGVATQIYLCDVLGLSVSDCNYIK